LNSPSELHTVAHEALWALRPRVDVAVAPSSTRTSIARWQRSASTIQVAAAAKDLQVTAAAVKEDLLSMRHEKKTAKGGQVD
jgi:predicted ArsR family transcriptional regulator